MQTQPLVSIIIRTKNEEKWISSCLKSVFKQEYKNIEVIGTLINMVQKDKFPQKSGKTALNLYDSYKSDGNGSLDELNNAKKKAPG